MTMICNCLRKLIPAIALPFLSACAPQKTPYAELPKVSEAEVRRYAEQSVSFGNRYSGSTELRKYADWIRETISQSTKFRSSCHEFQERTLHGDVLFHNIIAEIPGKSRKFILIAAHYDIKRFNFIKDFQGANDGASGVAALLGMISALQKYEGELPCGIKFVFFDGEECIEEYGPADGLHGSRRLAKEWSENGLLKKCRAMILLDMVGDKDLTITIPKGCTKSLIDRTLHLAQENGLGSRFRVFESDMIDDHVPFLERGVPAIDLIDFNYGPGNAFWHTTQDSLDKISAQSIKTVADFALGLYWNIAED